MLIGQHTQNGYICDNLEEAIALFRHRGLEKDPMIIPIDQTAMTPDGPKRQKVRATMFWLNGLQYELIEPELDETNIYCNAPDNGGPIRFHHISMKVDDWDELRQMIEDQECPIAAQGGSDTLKWMYVDARRLFGHYLEYTWMTDDIWEQLKAM